MANKEHLAVLEKGVRAWNRWRARNIDIRPDLGEAELGGPIVPGSPPHGLKDARRLAELSGINFENTDLVGANLEWAALSNARFVGADLRGASLSESILVESDFSEADLLGASLRNAELMGASLRDADLGDADLSYCQFAGAVFDRTRLSKAGFTRSSIGSTVFAAVDLSEAKDLETVEHMGPSTIGINTIYESKGKIPEVFLRGAGVPEPFIVQMKALVNAVDPIQFY